MHVKLEQPLFSACGSKLRYSNKVKESTVADLLLWQGRRDSNPRPLVLETNALTS